MDSWIQEGVRAGLGCVFHCKRPSWRGNCCSEASTTGCLQVRGDELVNSKLHQLMRSARQPQDKRQRPEWDSRAFKTRLLGRKRMPSIHNGRKKKYFAVLLIPPSFAAKIMDKSINFTPSYSIIITTGSQNWIYISIRCPVLLYPSLVLQGSVYKIGAYRKHQHKLINLRGYTAYTQPFVN